MIVQDLQLLHAEADPLLRARFLDAIPNSARRFRYALGLLPTDPGVVDELLSYAANARAEEIIVLRQALSKNPEKVRALWPQLQIAGNLKALRMSALLAGFMPADEQWQPVLVVLRPVFLNMTPAELTSWLPTFEPLRRLLIPPMLEAYRSLQQKLQSGEVTDVQALARYVSSLDNSAILLCRFAADQPDTLSELLQTGDPRHFTNFLDSAKNYHGKISDDMQKVVERKPSNSLTDKEIEALSVRQANAVATLARLGDWQPAWVMLKHCPDPTARSYLVHGMAPRGVDPMTLIHRFAEEDDVSAKRALLLALGEFEIPAIDAHTREIFTERLLVDFREHPDPGLHGAIDWILRQKWGMKKEVDQIVSDLASRAAGGMAHGNEPQSPDSTRQGRNPVSAKSNDWFVNSQGQTFAIIRGPVEFTMGSPSNEQSRQEVSEIQHKKRIPRSFAIGVREVTVSEYLCFRPLQPYRKAYSPSRDGPINDVSWYAAVAYCRWLSEQDGVPETQQCYPPVEQIKEGMSLPSDFLERTGYRLPTEAEWEFTCRCGAVTPRPFGRGIDLLRFFAWDLKHAGGRLHPCGCLKPNDLGVFDMLGNAIEWCQDEPNLDRELVDDRQVLTSKSSTRLLRGGSYSNVPGILRSARRDWNGVGITDSSIGFRLARTIR